MYALDKLACTQQPSEVCHILINAYIDSWQTPRDVYIIGTTQSFTFPHIHIECVFPLSTRHPVYFKGVFKEFKYW